CDTYKRTPALTRIRFSEVPSGRFDGAAIARSAAALVVSKSNRSMKPGHSRARSTRARRDTQADRAHLIPRRPTFTPLQRGTQIGRCDARPPQVRSANDARSVLRASKHPIDWARSRVERAPTSTVRNVRAPPVCATRGPGAAHGRGRTR